MANPDVYVYYAIFTRAQDGISVAFPDLPGCCTCGQNFSEATALATEALGCHIKSLLRTGASVPDPSPWPTLSNLLTEPDMSLVSIPSEECRPPIIQIPWT